ncbi:MAG: tRNA-dihydrouridine synthase family protein [Patescibacteria group bacterium]
MSWLTQKSIIALAPMADMTDGPFTKICREIAGKDFVIFREMVSAEAIVRGNAKTLKMCEFSKTERPVIIQLFGGRAETIVEAAKIVVKKFKPDGIDINMGCPVPKITGKTRAGAALLKDIPRAVNIIKALKEAKLGVPISVKTRLGWNKEDEILDFASKLEAAGVDLISIHGRTKNQGYSGTANWAMIASVKKILTIPVLANGDIKNFEDIKKCLEATGADGVMIGRGALGNPWILSKNSKSQIPNHKLKGVILKHAKLHLKHYGPKSLVTFRKHLAWYINGERWPNVKNIKELRSRLVRVSTLKELEGILKSIPIQ